MYCDKWLGYVIVFKYICTYGDSGRRHSEGEQVVHGLIGDDEQRNAVSVMAQHQLPDNQGQSDRPAQDQLREQRHSHD